MRLVLFSKLFTAGASIDKAGNDGRTPLFVAAQEGYLDAVNALIDATADVNKSDLIGLTPLYIASEKNHLDVVKALLVAGASQVVDALGGTSLAEYSFDEGRKEVAEILTLFAAFKDEQKVK